MKARARPTTTPQREDVVLRIAAHLTERTDISSALEAVADEIAEVIPFTHADLCLIDRPGWLTSYEVGIRTRWSQARTRLAVSPIRDLIQGKIDVMLCDNAMEDPRQTFDGAVSEPIFKHELRSRVHVLLKVMGQPIGALNISHSTPGIYTAETIARAQYIADVLAPYFHALHTAETAQRVARVGQEARDREEGLRQGARELTEALEHQKQRIGMDLHDQTLADLTRMLRDITSDAPPSNQELARRISLTINDLRQIIDTAVPTLLELFGFAHAVRVHLERAAGSTPIELHVTDETNGAPDRLNATTRTTLFRIAQEAINNAVRHSGANRIEVTIKSEMPQGFAMIIHDDGAGIPKEPARQSGLTNIRTRAQLIGANLSIRNSAGTSVQVSMETPS
ncbi:ATP-binding protein [Ruegeria sp. 2205SS24-7]|uniref:GAF domain-containing sensor histidine kinase n=1 Tax=Ruegeria discodermiae TaxID=3064389 RepID=UPI0027408CB9|nr:ATP-binding protein [Ruegeria sp. 2205SS24-7]MDP5221032.1 ATP-binding protein [Ruegeria sp. 2205SS24-7]